MDLEKNNPQQPEVPEDDGWLNDILGEQEQVPEIEADEQAVVSAGLTDPRALDLESILAEDWDRSEEETPREEPEVPAENLQEEPVSSEEAAEATDGVTGMDEPTVMFAMPEDVASEEQMPALDQPQEPEDGKKKKHKKHRKSLQEPETEPGQPENAGPKTRPKRKRSYGLFGLPHLISSLIWLGIIVMLGVTLGNTLWRWCADLMAFGKPDKSITITITDDEVGDMDAITQKLVDAGLISEPKVFKFFAEVTGKQDDISAGTFTLNSSLDYNAMIKQMMPHSPTREIVDDLLIPEGYNCAQIFALLEEKGVCTVAELEEYAAHGELNDYWFLEGVERGDKYCLEGYLFPDTYDFYTNDDPRRVLEKMLNDFDYRFTDLMKDSFTAMQERYSKMLAKNGYDEAYIAEHQLTLHDVVTMASMVQKEMANTAEGYTIASVFYNRLTNRKEPPILGCDATVYYAIGDYFWEKEELTQEDLAVDNPYNTRKYQGLPPGPICNPGIYGLYSALDPDDTNYYYYVYSREDGKHLFTKTLAEHEALSEKLGY